MACTCTGTSFCSTVATTTGTGGAGPAATFECVQPDPTLTAASAISRTQHRKIPGVFVSIALLHLHSLTSFPGQRLRVPRRFFRHPYSAQPDLGQGAAYHTQIKILNFLPAVEVLNPGVINHHAKKSPCCQERVCPAEAPGRDSSPDEVR